MGIPPHSSAKSDTHNCSYVPLCYKEQCLLGISAARQGRVIHTHTKTFNTCWEMYAGVDVGPDTAGLLYSFIVGKNNYPPFRGVVLVAALNNEMFCGTLRLRSQS